MNPTYSKEDERGTRESKLANYIFNALSTEYT